MNNIDLTTSPTSNNELDVQRQHHSDILARLKKRERRLYWVVAFGSLNVVAAFYLMWQEDSARLIILSLVFMLVSLVSIVSPRFPYMLSLTGAVLAAGASLFLASGETIFLILVVAVAPGLLGFYVRHKYIYVPQDTCRNSLKNLAELNPTEDTNEYIKFAEMVENDKIIQKYQLQLSVLGRKPIMGEYQAALEWVGGVEKRRKIEQAKLVMNMVVTGSAS